MINDDGSISLYTTTSSTWVYSKTRKVVNCITDSIWCIYQYKIKDNNCYPEKFLFVRTETMNKLTNSITKLMFMVGRSVYVTLSACPWFYKVQCYDEVIINLQ